MTRLADCEHGIEVNVRLDEGRGDETPGEVDCLAGLLPGLREEAISN